MCLSKTTRKQTFVFLLGEELFEEISQRDHPQGPSLKVNDVNSVDMFEGDDIKHCLEGVLGAQGHHVLFLLEESNMVIITRRGRPNQR